ncbi:MAG: cytochrome C oxidase subunit IV family protein [Acidobacteria bacterium]|nr:cytochrome C oxidase subunit IV family protein [Acidobacteriota bacterium]MCL5289217.1 cytochrome C oxidase subunit IV family protein [Acidobacteriota bacterium]
MSSPTSDSHGHAGSTKLFAWVWLWLVIITGAEVYLAYKHLPPVTMLLLLIGMSVVKAGLIMSYFMHLRFEKASLVWTLIPATIFCIGMLTMIFPDGVRLRDSHTAPQGQVQPK